MQRRGEQTIRQKQQDRDAYFISATTSFAKRCSLDFFFDLPAYILTFLRNNAMRVGMMLGDGNTRKGTEDEERRSRKP